ncbi:MAG: YicC family protein [Acidobacteria bacterium]|nr:YicC family protein [Acidobacteriota bacterium]NIM63804.1 YicC family protein [Acidobacteriota bacterium]NIO58467.1 YicC family protein [Acidobacteriota bacterium]NIQ29759.1 YicC family protein [Acidobacteriota bacterium]NIQ84212.1 YicC family protein [Acidobacteriota bacterium]
MTGYGQGRQTADDLRVTVELKSVNNRFADVRFRLPVELAGWEARVRRTVLSRVRRGRVELSVRLERDTVAGAPALNRELLAAVLAGARQLRDDHGLEGVPEVSAILSIPGMFRVEAPVIEGDEEQLRVLDACLAAGLDALDADRLREGQALATELLERLATMQALTRAMAERAATVPEALRDRLTARLETLGVDLGLDPARVAQEAALLADRSDVTEELVRLEGHLAQAVELIGEPDGQPVGKRLDFLLQEIHRETNTVNSKSSDLELTRTALAMKAEAEKVREQVQNLE